MSDDDKNDKLAYVGLVEYAQRYESENDWLWRRGGTN